MADTRKRFLQRSPVMLAAILALSPVAIGAPAWQLLDDGDPGGNTAYLGYDSNRQRVVSVHATGFDSGDHVWELVGSDWQRRFPLTPLVDDAACAAFDAARGVLVVLGQVNDSTWTYDGTNWQRRFPTQQPLARHACQMVYDSVRQKVVLFGGDRAGVGSLQDTWEWNGTDWTSITTSSKPARRGYHGMSYDSARGVVVLHGGRQDSALPLNDTWEYNGTTWVSKTSNLPQPLRGRWGIELAYHPLRGKTYLFGGTNSVQGFNDTWQWSGSSWTQVVTPNAPSPRWLFKLTYAANRQSLVGWGGETSNYSAPNETWQFDGVDWVLIPTGEHPTGRAGHAMAYDARQQALVVFGGDSGATDAFLTDTWLWTPTSGWRRDTDAGTPTVNYGFPLVDEPLRARVIGFGGTLSWNAVSVRDVHEYSGGGPSWIDYIGAPDPRFFHGWVNAPELGGLILFGGRARDSAGNSNYSNETWVLSGSSWEKKTPAHAPQPRETMAITYDSTRREVLVYGGDPQLPDLWVYDGVDWVLRDPNPAPGQRRYSVMEFDPLRSRAVLFGGGPAEEQLTWEYDGTTWIAVSTPFQPDTFRASPTLSYAPDLDVILLFGGVMLTDMGDLWAYGDDPDNDGIVGGLDNCRQVINANQLNADGDAAGDACDCAPSDASAFSVPGEVNGLFVLGDKQTVGWESLAASSGSGARYDVVRGRVGEWPVGSGAGETCLSSAQSSSSLVDPIVPAAGVAHWYLVRGRNSCGIGGFGSASSGTTRLPIACP